MTAEFFRFPHTPHLVWLGEGTPRDDKVLSPAEIDSLLAGPVVVEEKLDGANLGFSVGPDGRLRAQNRGNYLHEPHAGQFQRLQDWMSLHGVELSEALGDNLIAFGEWCAARHSLDYPALPDWWLIFDIYDKREQKFWSTRRRIAFAQEVKLAGVPQVAQGRQTIGSLKHIVANARSRCRDGALEGIVIRREDSDWLLARAKLVRADFAQAIDVHWRSRSLQWNRVNWTAIAE